MVYFQFSYILFDVMSSSFLYDGPLEWSSQYMHKTTKKISFVLFTYICCDNFYIANSAIEKFDIDHVLKEINR